MTAIRIAVTRSSRCYAAGWRTVTTRLVVTDSTAEFPTSLMVYVCSPAVAAAVRRGSSRYISWSSITGSSRTRLPVALKIAFTAED
ncbi:hypothetical protein [Nonomuraea zeae]|uniref:Uncharacterized protein n=1 Tax=Nonomuraea zeae TaxID=1642303 RepID=A0A5S4GM16_9ACTN|nr:hypothetical protein [Nonomuraea zeae]TMR33957.1 hypothetical protein ETD85_18210 [Nonomuraea zeae]